jgi:glycosyltransferase involved in cell wall biosynthesis
VIGTVAGLKPVKDHFLLLDAFTIVRGEMPQVRLVIVGEGPLRAALEERARALAIADAVWFAGGVTDPAPVYRDLDLFVSSSKAEGTSISILEAMASGVAVVATSVGGSPDALAHGACGRLVPPADSARLASAIVSLLRERAERERLAAAARSRTVERYSENAMVEMYETVYRGTVGTFSCSTTSRVLQCAE